MNSPVSRRSGIFALAVGLLFVAAGCAMGLHAGRLYVAHAAFLAHSERATGTVVAFEQHVTKRSKNHYERQTYYAPVFTYGDRAGAVHRATSKVSEGGKSSYQVGQQVAIRYNLDHPDEAELDTFFASWGGVAILGGLGAAFCLAGGAVAWSGLRTMLSPGTDPNSPGPGGPGVPRDPTILSGG